MSQRYFVTDGDPNGGAPAELEFFDRLYRAIDAVKTNGLIFAFVGYEKIADDIEKYAYQSGDSKLSFEVVNDYTAAVRYFIVNAAEPADIDTWFNGVSQQITLLSLKELCQRGRRDLERDPNALIRMALATTAQADPEALAVLRAALQHSREDVRLKAVEAAALTRWPEIIAVLQQMALADPSAAVRAFVQNALMVSGVIHAVTDFTKTH